ncbi:radical SAM protein [Acidobacteriota bacterium]
MPSNSERENGRKGGYSAIINSALRIFFKDAVRVTLKNPSQALFFYRTVKWQRKAARIRKTWEQKGVHVPPIMIFSITDRCNLSCKGCYHSELRQSPKEEMSAEKIRDTLSEARDLGISFVVIAGGEPLVRREILDITDEFPEIIFLVFTNGMLIDDELIHRLKRQSNFVPVISLEGYEEETDGRRGEGVFENLKKITKKLGDRDIFWSVSLTITRTNFSTILDDRYIRTLSDMGCKLFFFLEYTPIQEGTEDWILTENQREELLIQRDSFRTKYKGLFIAVPGDEEEIGGCLAAGKGFVHISADGDVEPCPFAPYSDTNLRDSSLKDALQSEFLRKIRQNQDHLTEVEGGCALWIEREWVRSLMPQDNNLPDVSANSGTKTESGNSL